jgi:hypothetical protein
MTALATYSAAPTTTPAPSRTRTGLWKTGAVAGLAASAATVVTAAVADAAGVPLTVGGEEILLVGFAQLTFVCSMIGTVLAVVLARRARRPQHTFVVTTIVLTALSIIPSVVADATVATRSVLALTHVVAAAIVIPALASRLHDSTH